MNKELATDVPFFSVIIPAYNAAPFIGVALRSVFRQDCADYEIIVVNDGSTDNTAEVLANEKEPRLNIIHQKNSGAAAARNRGINEARGKYLAFLDADDVWLANHLSLAKYFFEKYPQYIWYSARCTRVNSSDLLKQASNQPESIARSYSICNWFLEPDILECGSNFFIKRDVALQWKPFYPEGIVLCEDNVAWSRLAMQYPKMGVPDCCTVLYRMWPGSAVHVYGKNADVLHESLRDVFRAHQQLFSSEECSTEAKLYFKRFSCGNWCSSLRMGGCRSWIPFIKEQRKVTGSLLALFMMSFSCLSHVLYRIAGKIVNFYIRILDVKIACMAKKQRIIGLK